MKIKIIWIAIDHEIGEVICATKYLDDMFDYLYKNSYFDDLYVYSKNWFYPVEEVYGKNWFNILKKFSISKLNNELDWKVSLRLIPLIEPVSEIN